MLDGLGEALQLDDYCLAPSRAVLHDFGNVSSRYGTSGSSLRSKTNRLREEEP